MDKIGLNWTQKDKIETGFKNGHNQKYGQNQMKWTKLDNMY